MSSQIHQYIKNNDVRRIKVLLRETPQAVHSRNSTNQTPLHNSCIRGNVLVSKLLLSHGARVNDVDRGLHTALHYACHKASVELSLLLLDYGANINATSYWGTLPLDSITDESTKSLFLDRAASVTEAAKLKEEYLIPDSLDKRAAENVVSEVNNNGTDEVEYGGVIEATTGAIIEQEEYVSGFGNEAVVNNGTVDAAACFVMSVDDDYVVNSGSYGTGEQDEMTIGDTSASGVCAEQAGDVYVEQDVAEANNEQQYNEVNNELYAGEDEPAATVIEYDGSSADVDGVAVDAPAVGGECRVIGAVQGHLVKDSSHVVISTEEHEMLLDVREMLFYMKSSLMVSERVDMALQKLSAHEKTLNVLVGKTAECPRLLWIYRDESSPPSTRTNSVTSKLKSAVNSIGNLYSELTDWMFADKLRVSFICPMTLCVVPCGPDGKGWEVKLPKQWVKQWGAAILVSLSVLQVAVISGRLLGIPIPMLPLPVGFESSSSPAHQQQSALTSVWEGVLEMGCEADMPWAKEDVVAGLRQHQGSTSPVNNGCVELVGNAYTGIHTFLTSGNNAKLGKLEDQLRGVMERVYSPVTGSVEWLSVEMKQQWLKNQKNAVQKPNTSHILGASASAPHTHTHISSTLASSHTLGSTNTTEGFAHILQAAMNGYTYPTAAADVRGAATGPSTVTAAFTVERVYSLCHTLAAAGIVDFYSWKNIPTSVFTNDYCRYSLSITDKSTRVVLLKLYHDLIALSNGEIAEYVKQCEHAYVSSQQPVGCRQQVALVTSSTAESVISIPNPGRSSPASTSSSTKKKHDSVDVKEMKRQIELQQSEINRMQSKISALSKRQPASESGGQTLVSPDALADTSQGQALISRLTYLEGIQADQNRQLHLLTAMAVEQEGQLEGTAAAAPMFQQDKKKVRKSFFGGKKSSAMSKTKASRRPSSSGFLKAGEKAANIKDTSQSRRKSACIIS